MMALSLSSDFHAWSSSSISALSVSRMDSKAISIVLHYLATDIPCALPTNAEIEESEVVLSAYSNRKVVRVGRHFVVKYGEGIDIIEGENMLYVRKATTITVPKVYALYTELCTGKNFIIMEFVEGDTLALIWQDLSATQKSHITTQLRDSYDELRQLPSPGYFGSLGKRPLLDEIFWTREKIPSINGPFETEHTLNEAMAQKYVYDGRKSYKADYYRQSLPHVFRDHRPTYTHADCQRKNIIVRKVPPREGYISADQFLEDEFEVTIIDWEKAGWYPSYWEFCLAIYALRWDDDWCLRIQDFLLPYYAEAPWLQMLRFELWS